MFSEDNLLKIRDISGWNVYFYKFIFSLAFTTQKEVSILPMEDELMTSLVFVDADFIRVSILDQTLCGLELDVVKNVLYIIPLNSLNQLIVMFCKF